MKQKSNRLAALIFALCMTAATSHAATIVYGFSGTANPMVVGGGGRTITMAADSNDFGSGITASVWTATSSVRSIGFSGGAGGQVQAQKSADTDTHTFTVTIPTLVGQTLSLTNLSFNWGEFGSEGAVPAWTISSNVGSLSPNTATGTNGSSNFSSLTLSGLTNLSNTTVTFTLLDNSQGNNKNNTFYGSTTSPSPARSSPFPNPAPRCSAASVCSCSSADAVRLSLAGPAAVMPMKSLRAPHPHRRS